MAGVHPVLEQEKHLIPAWPLLSVPTRQEGNREVFQLPRAGHRALKWEQRNPVQTGKMQRDWRVRWGRQNGLLGR